MSEERDDEIRASWSANADAWIAAVREGGIASRLAGTDAAVLTAIRERTPRRVLDVGCGEGWLLRALAAEGMDAVGFDAVPALVAAARAAGSPEVVVLDYAGFAADPWRFGPIDLVVCNFALLDADPSPLLRAARRALAPGGALLIQTLHPWSASGGRYVDGWRREDFAAFGGRFARAMPWWFRTMASWVSLLAETGWSLIALREPRHPETDAPLSLLLIAEPCTGAAT